MPTTTPRSRRVTCYVSRAKTGGIKGGLGLAEDKAEASIACRQTGPISFPKPLKTQDEMFSERISLVFKRLRVVRMVDATRNTLVYLTYSDRVIEGSPQNSVTAVPVDRAHADSGAVENSLPSPYRGRPVQAPRPRPQPDCSHSSGLAMDKLEGRPLPAQPWNGASRAAQSGAESHADKSFQVQNAPP
jgi:hypothetical protein